MTPEELERWMVDMGRLRGKERLAEREAAELLGCSRQYLRNILAGKTAPRYVGYACKWLRHVEGRRRNTRTN